MGGIWSFALGCFGFALRPLGLDELVWVGFAVLLECQ